METYSKNQFISFVLGFLGAEEHRNDQLTPNSMKAALNNALVTFDSGDDGFKAYVERQFAFDNSNLYRFDSKYEQRFQYDDDAFEEAASYHDDRSASVEKWIDGRWCFAVTYFTHPQYFYNGKDGGGWMTNNGVVKFNEKFVELEPNKR